MCTYVKCVCLCTHYNVDQLKNLVCIFSDPLQWDTTVQLAQEPSILDGGYAMWYLSYSPLCVGVPRRVDSGAEDEQGGGALNDEKSG